MIELIKYYLIGLKRTILKFFKDLKPFGLKISIFNFLGVIMTLYGKFDSHIAKKQHDYTYEFLVNKYNEIINEYSNKNIHYSKNNKKIWCFWWQGLENAPNLVKKCIINIKKYSEDYEVIILDKNNYEEYVNLPPEIIKKFNENKITPTHFSDILRARLLSLYGGIWIDATVFVCDYVFNEFDDKIFNCISFSEGPWITHFTNGRWAGFFMGGKPNKLFSFLYDMLLQYNLDHDILINYLLIDYIIEIAYDSFEECKEYIDNTTLKNSNIFYLLTNFSQPSSPEKFKKICEEGKFFKLSYKTKYQKYDKNGDITNYGIFLEE